MNHVEICWNNRCGVTHNRRKFRSQTSDSMDRWKAEMGRVREKRRVEERREEERRSEKRKSQKQEDAGARKGRKVAKHNVFPCFSNDLWLQRVDTFRSQNVQNTPGSDHFWKLRCWKSGAVVARSTFASEKGKSTSRSDHFWKLRCWKSACRCGAKHVSISKCTKHTRFGPLLEVEMSKKCTPLWREAHFEVKMYKTHQVRTTFGSCDVEKVHAVVARSTFASEKVKNTSRSDHFWKLRCLKSARRCGAKHISRSKR